MKTKIVYDGCLEWKSLKTYTSLPGSRPKDYLPDEDIRILNLITCKSINSPDFPGARFGKKFFPTEQDEKHHGTIVPYKGSKDVVYQLKTGFFSSVRPSHGNLLLTINTAMSAFYPKIKLRDWIDHRWTNKLNSMHRPDSEEAKELNGVRVTFEGDDLLAGGTRKKRVICGLSDRTLSSTRFAKFIEKEGKTKEVDVFTHMTSSKCSANMLI